MDINIACSFPSLFLLSRQWLLICFGLVYRLQALQSKSGATKCRLGR
jgi:hypothetical protein